MKHGLFSVKDASAKIAEGKYFIVSGNVEALQQLPAGNWIGGTTPNYYIAGYPRDFTNNEVFMDELPDCASGIEIKSYTTTTIPNIFTDAPENGFTVIVTPHGADVTDEYVLHAAKYDDFGIKPIIGWVSGAQKAREQTKPCYSVLGTSKEISTNLAVVLHVSLPQNKFAEVNIRCGFKEQPGTTVIFEEDVTTMVDAIINGKKQNVAEYLRQNGITIQYPLMADYSGVKTCATISSIAENEVPLFGVVYAGIEYHFSELDTNHQEWNIPDDCALAYCCIYYASKPEPEMLAQMTGAAVFGEIAYQLFAQSVAYLTIGDGVV
ncbi:MAG: hypothetical protein LBV39_00045 [Bacteroidales bacterium]|nr:hypothetical protein [Bacteroidales bacterium]